MWKKYRNRSYFVALFIAFQLVKDFSDLRRISIVYGYGKAMPQVRLCRGLDAESFSLCVKSENLFRICYITQSDGEQGAIAEIIQPVIRAAEKTFNFPDVQRFSEHLINKREPIRLDIFNGLICVSTWAFDMEKLIGSRKNGETSARVTFSG
ncbi:MAG: hypothetical protein ACI4S9_01655 [Christensenellales bacterium]